VIQNNQRSYQKDLWSELGDGEKIAVNIYRNDREETTAVVNKLREYYREFPAEEIVIFYRTNSQSRIFEDALLKYRVPYIIIGGMSFYQRREIKDILSLLRLIISPSDYLSFARTINLPKRGIGPTTLNQLKSLSETYSLPILATCQSVLAGEIACKLSQKQRGGITQFCHLIARGKEMLDAKEPIHHILKEMIYTSGYLDHLREDKETFDDRKSNIDELITKALEWESEAEDPSLLKFLEELSLKSSLDEVKDDQPSIRLMTLHNGKGMEFEVCFMVGLEEDLFPHINSKDSPEALEEERRLCYVGITRARKHLHISAAKYRILWGIPRIMYPSRFLREIPKECIQTSYIDHEEEEEISEGELYIGTTVFHKTFGKGNVRKIYEGSFGLTYDIYFFDEEQTRSLVAKYAKLKLS